jgi:hypothetical protein
MSSHLVIGLGGTGGKVIRSFRKLVFQQFHEREPKALNIQYLYVDSSSEMMAHDDPNWKILGKNLQLDKHRQLLIKGGADLSAHLENLSNYPGIQAWIGDKSQWKDILNSIVGEILGGQKRRLGRFLFACKVKEFRDRVQALVRDLQNASGNNAVTFHICCGLAGGTGSGSIVDAVCQIREMYPNDKIILYTLLPDSHPKPNWDTGNYHANGYAALLELNALSIGAWQPHDVTGNKSRLQLKDPFNGCYLFFNKNENDVAVDVERDVPDIVADFLFQKLVVMRELRWESLARMENAENGDGTPECTLTGSPERSKRFLAFGLKRLAYPETEIREFLTYHFAKQTGLQMLFNNWTDGIGFHDEPKPYPFAMEVRKKEVRERWAISDEHLTLSRGILIEEVNTKTWQPFAMEWQNFIVNSKLLLKDSVTADRWVAELQSRCQDRFERGFRQHGVHKFFEIKTATHADHAREIRRRIESELFEEWRNGTRSLYDIKRLLEALLQSLDEYLRDCAEKVVFHQTTSEAIQTQRINPNRREESKVGVFSAMLGKREQLFEAQSLALQDYYFHLTCMEGWQFAQTLLPVIVRDITAFANEVDQTLSSLVEINKLFQKGIDERCQNTDKNDFRRPLVYFYHPDIVRSFSQRLVKDKAMQANQAMAARDALINQLGENANFSQLNARILKQQWMDSIESVCEQSVENAHNTVITVEKDLPRQLNVSIIEKLAKEFSGNEEGLTRFVHDLANYAGNYLTFNPLEVNKKGPGIAESPTKLSVFAVIRPQTRDWGSFATQLDGILKGSRNIQPEILQSETRNSEITFINITNLFPLRYVQHLVFLKERYDLRLKQTSNPGRLRLELHCEGDGNQHPPLYTASEEDNRRESLPYLLIARAVGAIQLVTSPSTGKSELNLLSKDSDGFDNDPILLGATLPESVDKLNIKNSSLIKSEVQRILQQNYQHVDKQKELVAQILVLVEGIKADECQGDINAPLYKRFNEAGKLAVKIIRGDA